MRKYLRYLTPFKWLMLGIVLLLAVQAICELLLPDYMSDIVNVGIQQGGFVTGAPDAASSGGMRMITAFMTDEEQKTVLDAYELVPAGSSEYEKEYPAVADTDIYVRRDLDEAQLQSVSDAFGLAEWTLIRAMQENSETRKLLGDQAQASSEDLDISGLSLEEFLKAIPALEGMSAADLDKARQEASEVTESVRAQTACSFARMFGKSAGQDTDSVQRSYMARMGLAMAGIAAASAVASIFVGFLASRLGSGAARNLRRDLFRKAETFSPAEFHTFATSSMITRTTNDVTQTQQFTTMGVRMLLFSPIMGIGGIVMALRESARIAWTIAVAVGVMFVIIGISVAIVMPKFKIVQKLLDRVNLMSRENLSGLLVVRAFRTQKHEEDRFSKAADDLGLVQRFTTRAMSALMPCMMLIMNLLTVLVVWVGAQQVQMGTMQVGNIMAYIQYATIVVFSFLMVAGMFIMIPRAQVSLERIFEVIDTESSIQTPKDPKPMDPGEEGVVRFDHVCFQYPGAETPVLEDITFEARPGQTTAIIGPTGCGKSTLVGLIPRFYDATGGSVDVGGVNVKDVDLRQLREEIGYVPQKGQLFSGTIASNLRYGAKDATDADLEQVAEIAQAADFIHEKPEGFDAPVAQGGTNVSGGQRQRLAIARALAKKAPIYIFDDSFSALDAKTDAKARAALRPYTRNATTIIVAQKISSILDADQILVLEEGRIVGKGRHDELIRTCPQYIEIAESQLGTDFGKEAQA